MTARKKLSLDEVSLCLDLVPAGPGIFRGDIDATRIPERLCALLLGHRFYETRDFRSVMQVQWEKRRLEDPGLRPYRPNSRFRKIWKSGLSPEAGLGHGPIKARVSPPMRSWHFFFAECAGEVCGMALMESPAPFVLSVPIFGKYEFSATFPGRVSFFVKSAHRSKGLGAALAQSVERWVEDNYAPIGLPLVVAQDRALKLMLHSTRLPVLEWTPESGKMNAIFSRLYLEERDREKPAKWLPPLREAALGAKPPASRPRKPTR